MSYYEQQSQSKQQSSRVEEQSSRGQQQSSRGYRQSSRGEHHREEYQSSRGGDHQTSRNHQKIEYNIPEKPYNLDECANPEDEICHMTSRYAGFAQEVKDRLFSRLDHRNQQVMSIYGRFNAPTNQEMVEKINGNNDYFLKKTMQASDVDLIWYDSKYNKYRFWGPSKFKVVDAMNRIRSRIIKYVVHVHTPVEMQEYEDAQEMMKLRQKAEIVKKEFYQMERERELKSERDDAEFLIKKITDFDAELITPPSKNGGDMQLDGALQQFLVKGKSQKAKYVSSIKYLMNDISREEHENYRHDFQNEIDDLTKKHICLEKLMKQVQTHLLMNEKIVDICVPIREDDTSIDSLMPMMHSMSISHKK